MSTYLSLHYHIIFSTRHREPWLAPALRVRVHKYLGGTVKGLRGEIHGVGGMGDHVHLPVTLRATHCLSDFMRELKKTSSLWIKEEFQLAGFGWQDGYCALTVSPSARSAVHDYIARQEMHHRTRSFREEFIELLGKAGIDYNEKYLD